MQAAGLALRLRERTADLHTRAERTGVVAAILAGTVTLPAYALWLRNLLPAYEAMEQAIDRHREQPGMAFFANAALHRAGRIVSDLVMLSGDNWNDRLRRLPASICYANRVTRAGADGGALLIAHAYTRYLGDLSGGRTMRRRLAAMFGADFPSAFTEFPGIAEPGTFAAEFRLALDAAAARAANLDQVADEAAVAFQLNIDLSQEVAACQQ